ncbi:MAG: hypothetical protein HY275_15100 [Gemmatimonadetes bacterium]|nr:hypothetical protein [Gemmatimonadota bacterium]
MTRLARFLLLASLAAVLPRVAPAQFALDSDLRRAIQVYQAGRYDAAALDLQRIADRPTLTTPDRAVALLYRGFALTRLKRDGEAARSLELAVIVDPTLRPDPVTHSPELLDAFRRARNRVPLLASFEVSASEFVLGIDSAARIDYTFEIPAAERRYSAQLRLLMFRVGSADTAVVWRGDEGTVARWDGNVKGQPVTSGMWEMVLEARAPGSEVAATSRRRVEIEVLTASVDRRLPIPTPPKLLPESVTYNRVDEGTKEKRVTRGLWMLAVGGALAAYSNANYQVAIDETPKGSGQRIAVAGAYVGGAAFLGFGAWYALTGWFRSYESPVAFYSTENVRRNRDLRQAYVTDSTRVAEHNRALMGGRLVRLRFVGEGSR